MTLHPSVHGFAQAARTYERARPDYPPEVVTWLATRLDLRAGRTVMDLAAGTGKLTRLLLATGATVIAVEPLAAMREVLAEQVPDARILEGTAEAIPLADGSLDAVTVAQAFHWFDGEAALTEIARVLRPGGHLALVWNRRDSEDPLQAAVGELLEPFRAGTPAHGDESWRSAFTPAPAFSPLEIHEVAHAQQVDAEGLVERVASISFVAGLPQDQQAVLLDDVRRVAPESSATFPLRYRTEVFACTRR